MTPEQRLDRIEAELAAVVATLHGGADAQQKLNDSLFRVSEAQQSLIVTVSQLTETVSRYVDSADSRMKRIEQNLDRLIRAITAEHSNGKGKK